MGIYGGGGAHSARAQMKRQGFPGDGNLLRFEDAKLVRLKIYLDSASAKKVCTQEPVNRALAGSAQRGQVNGEIVGGQRKAACIGGNAFQPVASESACDSAHCDC